ncbi:MAG: hypothetical protein R3E79_52605 [Caldilineaceae bacterium]
MTALTLLLNDMNHLQTELSSFATKFGVKSQDFYTAFVGGELEEFDALDEFRMDFIRWSALYKTWLSLNENTANSSHASPLHSRSKQI